MPTLCCRFTGLCGWVGRGTSLIYTCLRRGSLPGSPERSYSRTKGLVLFPILPLFGPAHPFPSHPSSRPCSTYLGYLPFTHHASPHSASHPPITSPTRQPPSLSHPLTSTATRHPFTSLCSPRASVYPLIIHLCTQAFHPSSVYLAAHLPTRPFTHLCVVQPLLGGVLALRAFVFGTKRTCWLNLPSQLLNTAGETCPPTFSPSAPWPITVNGLWPCYGRLPKISAGFRR